MHADRTTWLRWLIPIGGVGLLAALFVELGPARILALLQAIGVNFALVVAIFAVHECVRALALSRCLPRDERPPYRQLLRVRFAGEAVRTLTHTGPFLSEPARAWMLARQGLRGAHAYGAAVSELIANSCISSLVTVAVLLVLLNAFEPTRQLVVLSRVLIGVSLLYAIVVIVALAKRLYVIGGILRGLGSLPVVGHRLRVNPAQVRQVEDVIMHVLRDQPGTLVQVVLLELAAQAALVLEVYGVLSFMDLPASLGTALEVEALTKLANVVQFVGATEGGYALVFSWLGLAGAAGFTLSFVKRLRSLAVAALGLGILALFARRSWARA